jgi:phosphate-selective porin OprO/OprP
MTGRSPFASSLLLATSLLLLPSPGALPAAAQQASPAPEASQASPSADLLPAAASDETGHVTGQVLLVVDGESPLGLEVHHLASGRRAMVNQAGTFDLRDLPAGEQELRVVYRGVELHRQTVKVTPDATARVRMRPGAVDPRGTPGAGAQDAGAQAAGAPAAQQRPPSELDRLLALLVEQGVLTPAQVETLRTEVARERQEARVELGGAGIAYEPTLPIQDDGVSVQVLPFGIETWDGSSRFRFRGRAQLDGSWARWGDDIQNVARQGNEFPTYGLFLRRVRMGAAGIVRQHFEWQVEADFSENEVDLANVYVAYLAPNGRLAAGYFKEPFGMEYATSSRYISFIERSAASDAYKVNREMGIMYETLYPNWYMGLNLSTGGVALDRDLRKGWAATGRLSFAPYLQGSDFVHIGAGANFRANSYNYDDEEWTELRLRTREGVRAIDARLIGRDDLVAVEQFRRANVELAAGFGPWWVQGEYLQVDIDLDREALEDELGGNATDLDALTQSGWYVQTGFFLTGESRNYRAFSGDFGPQFPMRNFSPRSGDWGALELAARYSQANSLEHTRVGRGQKMDHYTLGLNWYLTPEVAVKTNLMYLQGERDEFQDDAVVLGIRFQLIF